MFGVVNFIRSLVFVALALGAAGTLVEATGFVGREAAKAHQHGGLSFKWLNQQLVGGGKRAMNWISKCLEDWLIN